MQNTKKLASLFEDFGIKCWIIWSKLMQIMWFFKNIYLYKLNLICLCLPFYKVYKFYTRKYVPTVKRMNQWMNQWMKKMAESQVDKEWVLFQRTHNSEQNAGKISSVSIILSIVTFIKFFSKMTTQEGEDLNKPLIEKDWDVSRVDWCASVMSSSSSSWWLWVYYDW